MMLVILASIIFALLIGVSFVKNQKRLLILSICVILLIICNFVNEIKVANKQQFNTIQGLNDSQKLNINALKPWQFQFSNTENVQWINSQLLQQQKQITNFLHRRKDDHEFLLISISNLHRDRLKYILQLLKYRANMTKQTSNLQIYMIDYKSLDCDQSCLAATFANTNKGSLTYKILIIENIEQTKDLARLQQIYLNTNVTIIFQSLPNFFPLTSIYRMTYIYPFSNNYLPRLVEHHSSKTVQYCASYRNFDYNLYAASLSTPLLDLCSKQHFISSSSRCIRKLIRGQNGKIPLSWIKKCQLEGPLQGILQQNGWISIQKDHYWSERGNRSQNIHPQQLDL